MYIKNVYKLWLLIPMSSVFRVNTSKSSFLLCVLTSTARPRELAYTSRSRIFAVSKSTAEIRRIGSAPIVRTSEI